MELDSRKLKIKKHWMSREPQKFETDENGEKKDIRKERHGQ